MNDIISIYRYSKSDTETLGILMSTKKDLFHTLELPDKGNKPNISCIPEGCYKYKKWYSPHFKTTVLRLKDVPRRKNILLHPANFVEELRGCIAVGLRAVDINNDGTIDVASSRKAIASLVASVSDEGIVCINNKI